MPRNTLKSFPTAMLRRGLAHFHPGSSAVVQPSADPPGNHPHPTAMPVPVPVDTAPSPACVARRVTDAPVPRFEVMEDPTVAIAA